jgi:hypothetical protein
VPEGRLVSQSHVESSPWGMVVRFGWNRFGVRWVDDELWVLALQFAVLYDDSDDLGCVLAIICLKFIHHINEETAPKISPSLQ